MSLRHEARGMRFSHNEQELFERTEDISELQDGIMMPLSSVMVDHARPWFPPTSEELFHLFNNVYTAFPENAELKIRGSTAVYSVLRLRGIERRGTFPMAIASFMGDIRQYASTHTAQTLNELAHKSDFDLFFPSIPLEVFQEANNTIWNRLGEAQETRIGLFHRSQEGDGTSIAIRKQIAVPYSMQGDAGFKRARIHREDGEVAGIAYSEADVRAEDGKRLLTVFWTPAPESATDRQDTRLDPAYALSWDVASVGTITRTVPVDILMRSERARRMREGEQYRPNKRMIHQKGVFPPAEYASTVDDIWIHYSQESLQQLTKPITIGERFHELPIIDQVKLALRACQKGALGEESLHLSEVGREALQSGSAVPAISEEALAVFQGISVDAFREAYEQLPFDEKETLQKEIMQSVIFGLFYPAKFLDYLGEANLFRFFPQFEGLNTQRLRTNMHGFLPHDEYTKMQYTASHYHETHVWWADRDFQEYENTLERTRNIKSWINPYGVLGDLLSLNNPSYEGNYMEVLDSLFSLDSYEEQKALFSVPRIQFVSPPSVDDYAKELTETFTTPAWLQELRVYKKYFAGFTGLSAAFSAAELYSGEELQAMSWLFLTLLTGFIAYDTHKKTKKGEWLLHVKRGLKDQLKRENEFFNSDTHPRG